VEDKFINVSKSKSGGGVGGKIVIERS